MTFKGADGMGRDQIVEIMAEAMYGKKWNDQDQNKRPGERLKDVWRKYCSDALTGLEQAGIVNIK
jgi:hypothetical protein